MFEESEDEFRFTFQYAIQPRPPAPNLLDDLQAYVYTDGSCINPTLPTMRHAGFSVVVDSCRSDSERCWHAQRYKETGEMPPTLHVVIQELCPQAQSIHHAELRAIVRPEECFCHAVIHVDSSSAMSTFVSAQQVHGVRLHKHPHPELCLQIQQLHNSACNRLEKIKAHTIPQDLPDLLCYHALGNMVADRAASAVCTSCHPTLTGEWMRQADARKHDMEVLTQFYRLSLALQCHRKNHEQHVPASFNPMEPHPMRQAAAYSTHCANWTVNDSWKLNGPLVRAHKYFSDMYA